MIALINTGKYWKYGHCAITVLGKMANVPAFDIYQGDRSHRKGFRWVTLEELLTLSDVVSLQFPLFPETRGIDKEALKKMKSSAFLINTSREQKIHY